MICFSPFACSLFTSLTPPLSSHLLPSLPQVIGGVNNNALLVLVGIPMIPVSLITLEAMDVEARQELSELINLFLLPSLANYMNSARLVM